MYRMVIVEDEAIIRSGLATAFDWKALGFSVEALLEDGGEALEYISSHPVDAVLSDIKMPGMDGLELMRRLRSQSEDVQVVFLTGYADFTYVKQSLAGQAFDYILKLDLIIEVEPTFRRLKEHLDKQRALRCFRDHAKAMLALMEDEQRDPIGQAQRYVLAHFTENLKMEDVARRFFMSPAHFSRSFKRAEGCSFSDRIKDLRLQLAYQLLGNTQLLVQDIARQVGYTDLKYFAHIFKERYGQLPSAVRDGEHEDTE